MKLFTKLIHEVKSRQANSGNAEIIILHPNTFEKLKDEYLTTFNYLSSSKTYTFMGIKILRSSDANESDILVY